MNKIEKLVEKIKEKNPERVFVQLPEGLITKSQELEDLLEKEGIESFVSLEPCYGACDLRDCEAERLGCDLLVHVGHSDFGLDSKVPVLSYEWRIDFDPVPILKENMDKIKDFEKIGLLSTVNFLGSLEKAKEFLESHGKECVLGRGKKTKYPGQILGCDPSAGLEIEEKINCFLFIGSGVFHPLGVALKSSKPVFVIDREKKGMGGLKRDKFERQSHAAQAKAKDAEKFGILLSTKPGQLQVNKALEIKKKIKEKGKKAWIFTMDSLDPKKLLGLDLDCYVNCACPRVAIENRTNFKKPILNPDEVEEALA